MNTLPSQKVSDTSTHASVVIYGARPTIPHIHVCWEIPLKRSCSHMGRPIVLRYCCRSYGSPLVEHLAPQGCSVLHTFIYPRGDEAKGSEKPLVDATVSLRRQAFDKSPLQSVLYAHTMGTSVQLSVAFNNGFESRLGPRLRVIITHGVQHCLTF